MDQTKKAIESNSKAIANVERNQRNINRTQEQFTSQMEQMQQIMVQLQAIQTQFTNEGFSAKLAEIKQTQDNIIRHQTQQSTTIDTIKTNQGDQRTTIDAINGTILPQFTIEEEARQITRASKIDIFANTDKFGLDDEAEVDDINDNNDNGFPNDNNQNGQSDSRWMREHREKKQKTLLREFTPKLTPSSHLAEWYNNFEFYARCHKIPKTVIEARFIIDLVDDKIRNKYLLEKEIKELTNEYETLQKWLFDPTIGKKQILKQKEAIFKWKNSHNTIKEAYNSFLLIIRAYSRELAFAKQNGIPEFQFDRPSEASLVKYFISNVSKSIGNELTRTLTRMNVGLNMSVLKLACEKIAKSEETLLGMDVKNDNSNIKIETLITERVDKQVNEILAVRSYNNWGGSQNRNYNQMGGYNNRSKPNTYGNGYNYRGRGRGRRNGRGRWRNKRWTNPRAMKIKRGSIKCHHCKKKGHKVAQCWIKHPHLKKSFLERIKDQRARKSLFVIDYDVDGYLAVGPQHNPYDEVTEDVCQHDIFLMTNDDFDFEAVQQGYDTNTSDNSTQPDPSTTSITPTTKTTHSERTTNSDTFDDTIINSQNQTPVLQQLLNDAVNLDRPRR